MARLKRLVAPKFWPIHRKEKKFVISPRPGPHPKDFCIPLGVLIRDYLNHAENIREVKEILNKNFVKVDGIVRKDYKFPVGLMDIVTIGNEFYRIVPGKKGLYPIKIDKSEATTKLLKVRGKTILKGGKIQLNLHDGKNMLTDRNDIKPNDVLVFDLNSKTIKEVIPFKESSLALIIKGKSAGSTGKIEKIKATFSQSVVTITTNEKSFDVPRDYVFVVGTTKPIITIR